MSVINISIEAGFLWDMLDLNAVDWDAIAAHHVTEKDAA